MRRTDFTSPLKKNMLYELTSHEMFVRPTCVVLCFFGFEYIIKQILDSLFA